MNTKDLRDQVYEEIKGYFWPPLTKSDVAFFVDIVLKEIQEMLTDPEKEGKLTLRGFGSFKTVTRKGRDYVVKGQTYSVPDRETVVFKPGTGIMDNLRSD